MEKGIVVDIPKIINLRDGKRLLDVIIDDGQSKNTHRFWNQDADVLKNTPIGTQITFKRGQEFLQNFQKENHVKTHKIFNSYTPQIQEQKEQLFKITGFLANDLQKQKINVTGQEFLVVRGAIIENGNYTNIQIAGKQAEKFLERIEGGEKGQKVTIHGIPKTKEYVNKEGVKQDFKFLEPVNTYPHELLKNKELNVSKVNIDVVNKTTNAQIYTWEDKIKDNQIVNVAYTISLKNISQKEVEDIQKLKQHDKIQVTGDKVKIFDENKNTNYNFINPFVLNKVDKEQKLTTIIDKSKTNVQQVKTPVQEKTNEKKKGVSM